MQENLKRKREDEEAYPAKYLKLNEENKKICFIGLDADGCIFNSNYIKYRYTANPIIKCNGILIEYLLNFAQSMQYKEIRIGSFSNRQSLKLDYQNSLRNNTTSSFYALSEIVKNIQDYCTENNINIKITLDTSLLSDLEENIPPGTNWEMAVQTYDENISKTIQELSNEKKKQLDRLKGTFFDESKIILLLYWISLLQEKYALNTNSIDCYFIDDSDDILGKLRDFCHNSSLLIPKDFQINFLKYTSTFETLKLNIPETFIGSSQENFLSCQKIKALLMKLFFNALLSKKGNLKKLIKLTWFDMVDFSTFDPIIISRALWTMEEPIEFLAITPESFISYKKIFILDTLEAFINNPQQASLTTTQISALILSEKTDIVFIRDCFALIPSDQQTAWANWLLTEAINEFDANGISLLLNPQNHLFHQHAEWIAEQKSITSLLIKKFKERHSNQRNNQNQNSFWSQNINYNTTLLNALCKCLQFLSSQGFEIPLKISAFLKTKGLQIAIETQSSVNFNNT